jgi:4-amino-4-deoxy-L-arabinose transferase-like glycosyltransferase
MPGRRQDLLALLGLTALWALVITLIGIGGDYPLNDDWAYAWSARHLAETGEVRILDWASPSLVTHMAWGALLVRVFGPSYVVLRVGTLFWALLGLWLLYALGRRAQLGVQRALVLTLGLALSPWFVNLSFTYMTEVPWLTLTLAACLCLACATEDRAVQGPEEASAKTTPRAAVLLVGTGLLVGLAALSRQFSMLLLPVLALVAALDARRGAGPWWKQVSWKALGRGLAVFLPALLLYGAFHLWYTRVHGPTIANRETWMRMRALRPWHPLSHALAIWHYVGLWLAPLVAAVALAPKALRQTAMPGRQGQGTSFRRAAHVVTCILLVGYAACAFLITYARKHPLLGLHRDMQPTMPFLGNVVYLTGSGPPTLFDVYHGRAPMPHRSLGFGLLLTAISTAAGTVAIGWLLLVGRRMLDALRQVPGVDPAHATDRADMTWGRARVRLILLGALVPYVLWLLATCPYIFDRYLLPLVPAAFLMALDALPESVSRSRGVLLGLGLFGLYSVLTTREYLAWNAARDRAVRGLEARGIASTDIDGGFEVNGPRHFLGYLRRTGRINTTPGSWWAHGARYRLSFWPSRTPDCRTIERHPFWTWPGARTDAMYVLDCATPGAPGAHGTAGPQGSQATKMPGPPVP